jgi:hypothetical protein
MNDNFIQLTIVAPGVGGVGVDFVCVRALLASNHPAPASRVLDYFAKELNIERTNPTKIAQAMVGILLACVFDETREIAMPQAAGGVH